MLIEVYLSIFCLIFQLQNEKRRLERDLEEIKRQKEEQDDENERLRQEVASLRYVFKRCNFWHIQKFSTLVLHTQHLTTFLFVHTASLPTHP